MILATLAGFCLLPGGPEAAAATQCYSSYTLLDVIENYDGCTGAQGMAVDGTYYNYGLDLASYGIDGTAEHVYRMTNKLSSDGSNMVYLSVDGRELGPMNNYYLAGSAQGTTSNWISGKDFTFSYLGTDLHPLDDCSIEYIQVWGKGLLDQKDEPDTYRWENGMQTVSTTGLTANTATTLGGSVSGSIHTASRYALDRNVVLLHNRPHRKNGRNHLQKW